MTINYSAFVITIISFLIVAFAIFLLIRSINNMKKKEEEAPETPPEPPKEEQLLSEIRDLLKQK